MSGNGGKAASTPAANKDQTGEDPNDVHRADGSSQSPPLPRDSEARFSQTNQAYGSNRADAIRPN